MLYIFVWGVGCVVTAAPQLNAENVVGYNNKNPCTPRGVQLSHLWGTLYTTVPKVAPPLIMVPELYGQEHLSFNVHLLIHLVRFVEQWGPLWALFAFVFEDANERSLRSFHGPILLRKV
jgi:hypothetical protein